METSDQQLANCAGCSTDHAAEQEPCIQAGSTDPSPGSGEPETETGSPMIYKIGDRPPVHLTIFFGLQQAVISIAFHLVTSVFVAQVVCAEDDGEMRTRLLSSTLFMSGVTTLLMVTVGVRLPVFQGAALEYLSPLFLIGTVESTFCTTSTLVRTDQSAGTSTPAPVLPDNDTMVAHMNMTDTNNDQMIMAITSVTTGSLMVAGVVHAVVGATGLVGVLLRFVGPLTIVPAVLLLSFYVVKGCAKFVVVNIPVAAITAIVTIALSLYLGRTKAPVPVWNRRKGCHVIRYPFFQVFSILIGMIVGTIACAIITVHDIVPDDPSNPQYKTRLDARADILEKSSWFYFPYPGQFGPIHFSSSALVGCLLATVLSILDSVGDYFACARACHIPPPPRHAVNRGLAVEGVCAFLSGAVGCGVGTSTYAGNIGALGLTKVASRWVFITVGIIYIIAGLVGKVSAILITIPDPVLGGALMCIVGSLIGVIVSNLEEVSLKSSRNMTVLGMSLLVGIMVPHFIEANPAMKDTENIALKNFLKMFFGNANFAGALCAVILDNTVPGSRRERGLVSWQRPQLMEPSEAGLHQDDSDIYVPWMMPTMRTSRWLKYVPFLPDPEPAVAKAGPDVEDTVGIDVEMR